MVLVDLTFGGARPNRKIGLEVLRARLETTAAFEGRRIPQSGVVRRLKPAGWRPPRTLPSRAGRCSRCNGRTSFQTSPQSRASRRGRLASGPEERYAAGAGAGFAAVGTRIFRHRKKPATAIAPARMKTHSYP